MQIQTPYNQQIPNYYQPRKSRWWIPVLIIGIILFIIISLIIAAAGIITSVFTKEPVEVKHNTVLYINLDGKIINETPKTTFFSFLDESSSTTFFDIISAVRKAKKDDRIRGIYIKSGLSGMGAAMTSELLESLDDFKQSGKFIYAYFEYASETNYLKLLPADRIYMPEGGLAEFNGFGVSALFMKGLMDKLGIEFYVDQHEDFKSAGETISRRKFSDSARLNIKEYVFQRYNSLLDNIAKYRKLDRKLIADALNRGIYSPDSILALKLIDGILLESQVKDSMKKIVFGSAATEEKLQLVSISNYIGSTGGKEKEKVNVENQIALILADGAMVPQGGMNPFSGEKLINSKKYSEYFRKARENDKVKAVIFRINSPGGSGLASDEIMEEIIKTKKVKPVYASMSDVAASAGYSVVLACDTIVAQPGTLTGSIGVISIIPNITKLLGKLDITVDTLSTGAAAQDLNTMLPFSQKQKDKLKLISTKIYNRFVKTVADYRKKPVNQVRAIAKGRVWTGADAKKLGLVDTIGGLFNTISIAKKRLGIPENIRTRLVVYPQPKDELTAILELLQIEEPGENEESISKIAGLFNTSPNIIREFYIGLPELFKPQFIYLSRLLALSAKEPVLMAIQPGLEQLK